MKRREPVSHIMTKDVITVNITTPLTEIKRILLEGKIRHIPVVAGTKLAGIISKTDYMRLTSGTFYDNPVDADTALTDMFTLEDLMIKNPVVISSDTPIKEVAKLFIASDFHALPVVDNDALVGIVSTNDVLKFLVEMY